MEGIDTFGYIYAKIMEENGTGEWKKLGLLEEYLPLPSVLSGGQRSDV